MDQIINRLLKDYPWTNVYGLSRSSLALGTLITLCFNNIATIFPAVQSNAAFVSIHFFETFQAISLFSIFGYEHLVIAKAIAILILLFVISGFFPRVTGVLHWWVSFSLFVSSPLIDGGDQVTSIITLLLVPVTLFDSRKNHWEKPKYSLDNRDVAKLISVFSIFVIKIQVCIVYLQSAFAKFNVVEWSNGTAIYYWFTHNTFGMNNAIKFILGPIVTSNYGVAIMTWSVLVFEILMFCAIFMSQKSHRYFLILGISFHFAIVLIHGLASFFFAMLGALILYLRPLDKTFSFSSVLSFFNYSKLKFLRSSN